MGTTAPDVPNDDQLIAQVNRLADELDRRSRKTRLLETYYDGASSMPAAVKESKLTKAYRLLMPVSDAPWGSLVVDSVLDRLEVGGIEDDDQEAADEAWKAWQENRMDAESKLAHCSGLIAGRVFALVWPNPDTDRPQVTLDNAQMMVVEYQEGSRFDRRAALRRWKDADSGQLMATLYRPDGIYKFQQPDGKRGRSTKNWVRREVLGEEWPVPNPFGVVPVVEIRFNSRLKEGTFGHARGEYEHCLGLIDRINLLTFLGLVVAFWMGFPLRAVIGDRILRDDDGHVIPPFEVSADSVVQFENPNVKLDTFTAADRDNLSIFAELSQLSAITKTPRHYFPLAQAMANLSADAIRADEGGLNAKVSKHKGSAGEDWEEVMRLFGVMLDRPLSASASLVWLDHESRSLAERADAAVKLNGILPWQALAERVLNATQDDIARWQVMRSSDALSKLMAAATSTATGAAGGPPQNGNVTSMVPPAGDMPPAPAPPAPAG